MQRLLLQKTLRNRNRKMCILHQPQMHNKRGEKNMTTINDEIQNQINYTLNNQPYPTTCTITRTYPDNHADITTKTYGELKYIPVYGDFTVGDTAILLFLNNNYNDKVIFTNKTQTDYTTLLNLIADLTTRIETLEEEE